MMNDWQELDVDNMPNDLFRKNAWDIEYYYPHTDVWISCYGAVNFNEYKYRIRRPEGWEPKECPTCGSKRKIAFYPEGGCDSLNHDSWHDESIQPTHEEIMTKWWQCDCGDWQKVVSCAPKSIKSGETRYIMDGGNFSYRYFTSRQSADIPPEGAE